jgi:AcrR family transcriptional regulator
MAKPKGDHPKRVGPAARRRLVLTAAAGLFRRKGYRAVTVELIAEAAGVKPELLEKQFPAKGDVLSALYAEFHAAAFAPPAAEPADPAGHLAVLPDRFRKAVKAHAGVVAAVFELLAQPADDADLIAGCLRSSEVVVADAIRAGQAAGVVRRTLDPATAARDWLRYLFGLELLRPTDPPATAEQHPSPVADVLVHGLLKTDI